MSKNEIPFPMSTYLYSLRKETNDYRRAANTTLGRIIDSNVIGKGEKLINFQNIYPSITAVVELCYHTHNLILAPVLYQGYDMSAPEKELVEAMREQSNSDADDLRGKILRAGRLLKEGINCDE